MDGTLTKKGDVIYLVNIMEMKNGRKPTGSTRIDGTTVNQARYKVPIMKIVIGDDAPDNSQILPAYRPAPPIPRADFETLMTNRRHFRLERGGATPADPEGEWHINGEPWDPAKSMADVPKGAFEFWEFENGGGGWTHPTHPHQEEHRVVMRNGVAAPTAEHPDDLSRDDLIDLDPGESVIIARHFRTFVGPYVAHCHNLAHEDHSMMFGWTIQ